MGEKEKKDSKKQPKQSSKTHKHPHHPTTRDCKTTPDPPSYFKPSSDVKGLKFGAQFIVKSFTVRRATPAQLLQLLTLPDAHPTFPSVFSFIPTSFTILAHHAWHTLTLGLGTRKSKVVLFVFESEKMKLGAEKQWPPEIPLGEVNKKLIRGLAGCEMARFKFRKGAITFYVYAVRRVGCAGFSRSEDLRRLLQSVVDLKDFLDHTAMLALPHQRTISSSAATTLAA
uniref:DUF7851 domain-containing protein n=1 Tax=Kalanchoe fedtschenkoi TaxID=63787 RepID=A0A7N0TM88_KALFE